MITSSAPARVTQRDTFHKVAHLPTGLYLRIRRNGRVTLTDDRLCTWFPSRALAVETISKLLGHPASEHLEIARCDA